MSEYAPSNPVYYVEGPEEPGWRRQERGRVCQEG